MTYRNIKLQYCVIAFMLFNSIIVNAGNIGRGLDGYERITFDYYQSTFTDNGIVWDSITTSFETFFLNVNLLVEDSRDTSFYFQILDHLQHSAGNSETAVQINEQARELVKTLLEHKLTAEISKDCLLVLRENYQKSKSIGNVPWGFHVLGTCIIKYQQYDEDIEPAMVFVALKEMKSSDYNNDLYKQSIILMTFYMFK